MRQLLPLLAILLSCAALAQDWRGQGSIRSREYKHENRGPAGVESTDFFTLEYSVAIRIDEVDKTTTWMNCLQYCKGKVHQKHAECDYSCDDRCTQEEHKHTLKGEYIPDTAAMAAATRAANGLAVQGGGRVSPNDWSSRVSQALAEFRRECRKSKTFDMPHAGPCSVRTWGMVRTFKTFKVRGTMTKTGYRMSRGVRTPINETVGTHEQTVASGYIVQDQPDPTDEVELCACKPAEPPKAIKTFYDLFLPSGGVVAPEGKQQLEWQVTGPNGIQCFDSSGNLKFSADVEVTCSGNDMNTVTLVLTNNTGETVRVVLPPGVRFIPSDSAYQMMMNMTRMETTLLSGQSQTLYANVGEPPLWTCLTEEATSRWSCLEMAKKEPNSSVRYRLAPNRDGTLANLAAITAASRFRGPHDQARVWIYTDKASRAEINKRIIPGVGQGMYIMLLRDLALKGGVDLGQPAYRECVTPNLLSGLTFDDRAVRWFIGHFAERRPKELADFVAGQSAALAELPVKEGKDGAASLAWIVEAMMQEESSEFRQVAVKLLLAVPQGQRAAVAEAGGLGCARWLMNSGSADQYAAAMDVLEAYATEESKQLAMTAVESAPSDGLKARAAKVAGESTP